MPKVSVIMPVYNPIESYLMEAVDSVLTQTFKDIELIIINDGSTSDISFLDDIRVEDVTIIHLNNNMGVAYSRNKGIEKALGKYILPLDCDDKIHCEYVEKAVQVLENDEKVGIVYCNAKFFGEKRVKWALKEYNFPAILYENMIFNSSMYRKSDWELCGGYKAEMNEGFEDWEFWISLIEKQVNVFQINETLFFYRQNKISRTRKMERDSKQISMIKKIIKLHPDLYIDNLEAVMQPLQQKFEFYKTRKSFISNKI